MSGAKLLQPSLTGGELSPALHGRVDLARYQTSVKQCRNFIVRPYGGLENRTGFQYVADAGDVDGHRVIPFTYAEETSYVLNLGDGYIRFLSGGAAVAPATTVWSNATTYALDVYVTHAGATWRSLQAANLNHTPAAASSWWVEDDGLQITSPWDDEEIFELRFTQSADVLTVTHPDHQPRELRRLTANSFEIRLFDAREGPFLDLNTDESIKVASSAVDGTVTVTANRPIFSANCVGCLFYIEPKNLGQVRPWVVGDRSVAVGDLRRSEGKTYRAVTVPAAGTWHETGPRQPIHEAGRNWDGAGDTKTNGVDTWSVGIEWEYVDAGYGIVKITAYNSTTSVTALVMRRLPAQVVGGAGAPSSTWNISGDGATKTFAIAGAGYGVYAVTIGGVSVQPDPNYVPPAPGTGGGDRDGGSGRGDSSTVGQLP